MQLFKSHLINLRHVFVVVPETISFQENTQREVVLAIKLHRDNPVDKHRAVTPGSLFYFGSYLQVISV